MPSPSFVTVDTTRSVLPRDKARPEVGREGEGRDSRFAGLEPVRSPSCAPRAGPKFLLRTRGSWAGTARTTGGRGLASRADFPLGPLGILLVLRPLVPVAS